MSFICNNGALDMSMQMKTIILGTIVLTAATIYSLNKIPDPVVVKPARQPMARNIKPLPNVRPAAPHVARRRPSHPTHSATAVAKQKPVKRKPYFVVRNAKKNYDD